MSHHQKRMLVQGLDCFHTNALKHYKSSVKLGTHTHSFFFHITIRLNEKNKTDRSHYKHKLMLMWGSLLPLYCILTGSPPEYTDQRLQPLATSANKLLIFCNNCHQHVSKQVHTADHILYIYILFDLSYSRKILLKTCTEIMTKSLGILKGHIK